MKDNTDPEFDQFSATYEQLLKDPIRDRFSDGSGGFFHVRKADLIRQYFKSRKVDTGALSWLDLGCGKGDLLKLLNSDFAHVCGCDSSSLMIEAGQLRNHNIEARVQSSDVGIPFEDGQFDFVTAVCVFHHVPLDSRDRLTAEVRRVLKPGGVFGIIEHNPLNPVTQLIVSRTPVDEDAVLLRAKVAQDLMTRQKFKVDYPWYFLYLPEGYYSRFGAVESGLLRRVPLGGQYAGFWLLGVGILVVVPVLRLGRNGYLAVFKPVAMLIYGLCRGVGGIGTAAGKEPTPEIFTTRYRAGRGFDKTESFAC